MDLDQELCLCFHVSRRKVENYLRIHKPRRAAQLADCHGAGTGCGWCRPYLEQLFREAQANVDTSPDRLQLPSAEEYAQQRLAYRLRSDEQNQDQS